MKTSPLTARERNTALDTQILALLSHGPEDKIWSEREITKGLGDVWPVSICALERLAAAGLVKLTQNRNFTYLCQLRPLASLGLTS